MPRSRSVEDVQEILRAARQVGERVLVEGMSAAEGVIARRLFPLQLIICAAPTYLARFGAPDSLNELASHRCSVFRHPSTGRVLPWHSKVGDSVVDYEVVPALSTNDEGVETQAVLAGQVMGLMSAITAAAHLRSGSLVPLLAKHTCERGNLFIYFGSRTSQPARARALIDHTVSQLVGKSDFVLTAKELASLESKGLSALRGGGRQSAGGSAR